MTNKCVFLDRDGVINEETGGYNYRIEHMIFTPGAAEAIGHLKEAGYILIVVTNQAGIERGLYDHTDVEKFHTYMQEKLDYMIDDIYYSPYHPFRTESLSRKPGTLMFERAAALHDVDFKQSWMLGDKASDMIPAQKLGMHTIMVRTLYSDARADYYVDSLAEGVEIILK